MSTTAVRTLSELSDGGYYIPALASGLLYIHSIGESQVSILIFHSDPILFLFASFILLVSGSIMHSIEESVSGPQSKRGVTSYQTGIQRSLHVIYQQGKPSDYPKSWSEITDIEFELPRERRILAVSVFFFYFLLILSYPITIIELFEILPEEKYLAGGILFVEVAFILQTINQLVWPYSYLEEEIVSRVKIRDTILEFRTFFDYEEDIELEAIDVEMSNGGEVQIEYALNSYSKNELLESIEAISYVFAGTFLNDSYPCRRLIAIIIKEEQDVGTFTIEREWIEKLESGEITHSEFLDNIVSTLSTTE